MRKFVRFISRHNLVRYQNFIFVVMDVSSSVICFCYHMILVPILKLYNQVACR